ncbi:tripartite motif-containing protein 2-like [Anneissia japonica]|uniref:tripartite motif-containing protein 2-like n=1 Tax=Anneissia japonica TaxID=1529436 RepID=UPI001425A7D2|nr:tripartite motif-containing protein 2-like [Anneissia japonica]
MSAGKELQFLNKKDLECAICLKRFVEPKTLKCLHSYCLHCLESLVGGHGIFWCLKCGQQHKLKKEDLEKLTSNEKILYLLDYVEKIESEKKSSTCSSCYNPPTYHCSECLLYFCGKCSKHHKIIPALKNHQLYILESNEEGCTDENHKCPTHFNNVLEFYCSTCNKSACQDCNQVLRCYQNKHDVIEMKTAVDNFNQNASEVIRLAEGIKINLKRTLESIHNDMSEFESAVEVKQKRLIMTVQKKSKELISKLEEIHKEKKKDIDHKVEDINSKLTKANDLMVHINTVTNEHEIETCESYWQHLMTLNDMAQEADVGQSFHERNIIPNIIISTQIDELIDTEGIGKVTTVADTYKVAKDDEAITVTKGQEFVVKVLGQAENDVFQLSATLRNSSEEITTVIEHQGCGEYKIPGRCNVEGDWEMKITVGGAEIKGSPVNIKVESLGLAYTIDISKYTDGFAATGIVLDTNGYILVSSSRKYIYKFSQSGLFVARIQVTKVMKNGRMHFMCDGHLVYTSVGKCIAMCDDKFQEIRSFGKGTLKDPRGLTVNNKTRVLYVADFKAHCVFKFNVDDGRLLEKIGSKGKKEGRMNKPCDVTLTKEGNVIVAEFGNNRIQMFDVNDNFMRVVVRQEFLYPPNGIIMDIYENIIVSNIHKLEIFDKHGVFMKTIDFDESLCGIAVISNRPRRVAVANYIPNNVNIFNY